MRNRVLAFQFPAVCRRRYARCMENGPLKQNRRVKVVHKLAIRGLKNPLSTRISGLATRINPLKAMQVVDFPHLVKNNALRDESENALALSGGGLGAGIFCDLSDSFSRKSGNLFARQVSHNQHGSLSVTAVSRWHLGTKLVVGTK